MPLNSHTNSQWFCHFNLQAAVVEGFLAQRTLKFVSGPLTALSGGSACLPRCWPRAAAGGGGFRHCLHLPTVVLPWLPLSGARNTLPYLRSTYPQGAHAVETWQCVLCSSRASQWTWGEYSSCGSPVAFLFPCSFAFTTCYRDSECSHSLCTFLICAWTPGNSGRNWGCQVRTLECSHVKERKEIWFFMYAYCSLRFQYQTFTSWMYISESISKYFGNL